MMIMIKKMIFNLRNRRYLKKRQKLLIKGLKRTKIKNKIVKIKLILWLIMIRINKRRLLKIKLKRLNRLIQH